MSDNTSAWEQLSIETAQVLFCDLQKDIVEHSTTTSPEALARAAGALLQLAKLSPNFSTERGKQMFATACVLLVTFLPVLPLLSVPTLRSRMTIATLALLVLLYFLAICAPSTETTGR